MNIKKYLVTIADLELILKSYFTNFGINEKSAQTFIKSRYEILVNEKSLWSVELRDYEKLVGSAVLCKRTLICLSTPLTTSFYSQIWIEPEYRGRGYMNLLMKELQSIENQINSDAAIVIARKAVGSLYTKYGFCGFSKFPIVMIARNKLVPVNQENDATDLYGIQKAYVSTYGSQETFFLRSREFWVAILENQQSQAMQLKSLKISGAFFYYIVYLGDVVEIASQNDSRWLEIIDYLIISGMHTFKINEKHPAFKALLTRNATYTVRPEPREGHMIRINIKDVTSEQTENHITQLQKIISEMQLDIPLLDQW